MDDSGSSDSSETILFTDLNSLVIIDGSEGIEGLSDDVVAFVVALSPSRSLLGCGLVGEQAPHRTSADRARPQNPALRLAFVN